MWEIYQWGARCSKTPFLTRKLKICCWRACSKFMHYCSTIFLRGNLKNAVNAYNMIFSSRTRHHLLNLAPRDDHTGGGYVPVGYTAHPHVGPEASISSCNPLCNSKGHRHRNV